MPFVVFVCEGNRFRSQIAEGFFNAWAPPGWRAVSGGTRPKASVHPRAVELMKAVGVDIRRQTPKPFDLDVAAKAERVIAMCTLGACPVDVAEKTEHWDIVDPADLPEPRWREIRDEIAARVKDLIRELEGDGRSRTT